MLASLITPVVKGFGTDRGFATAVAMQQVFGGHGYITEWGMELYVRDARAAMLYEGANGIQALDLTVRKVVRDGGLALARLFELIEKDCQEGPPFMVTSMRDTLQDARAASQWVLENAGNDPNNVGAASTAFMDLLGTLALGWMWLRMGRIALAKIRDGEADLDFYRAKLATARYCAVYILPETTSLRRKVEAGAQALMALPAAAFAY